MSTMEERARAMAHSTPPLDLGSTKGIRMIAVFAKAECERMRDRVAMLCRVFSIDNNEPAAEILAQRIHDLPIDEPQEPTE